MKESKHNEFFATLHKDHEELEDTFEKVEQSSGAGRDRLFTQVKQELLPHQEAEEAAFYPLLEKNSETRSDAEEALKEHKEAEGIVEELDQMSPDSKKWMDKFGELVEGVKHHVEEEESKIFDDARQVISENQMEKVIKEFQEEKENAKSSLSGASKR